MALKRSIFLLSAGILIAGCSIQQSYLTGAKCTGKCTYLRMGVGRAQSYNLWGISTNKSRNLIFTAKNNLFRTFPLAKSEFYDNFIVITHTTYYPFVTKSEVVIFADIVTDDMVETNSAFSESYHEFLGYPVPSRWGLELSDSVVFVQRGKLKRAVIIDLDPYRATLMLTKKGEIKFLTLPQKKLFAIENENLEEHCGCEAGQVLEISSTSGNEPTIIKIAGLQKDKVLTAITRRGKTTYRVKKIEEAIKH